MAPSRIPAFLRVPAYVVLTVYLVAVGALFAFQRSLLFPAPVSRGMPRVPFAATFHGTDRGVHYLGLHRRSRTPDDLTYVYLHGNAEVVESTGELFGRLRDGNEGMAALEYSGYGALHDQPLGEWPMLASVDAGLHALYARGVRPDRVVLVGRSLGAAFAVGLAARGHGIAMVLFSPFTSVADAAAPKYPFAPVRILVRDRLESIRRAPAVTIPVLVFHGDADEVVPVEQGRRLARAFPQGRFVEIHGAGHHDIFVHPSADTLRDAFDFAGHALSERLARAAR